MKYILPGRHSLNGCAVDVVADVVVVCFFAPVRFTMAALSVVRFCAFIFRFITSVGSGFDWRPAIGPNGSLPASM